MTTKIELENLVASFEKANNRGSTKEANRILPQIVRAIVDFVENPGVPYIEPRAQAEALFSAKSAEVAEEAEIVRRIQESPDRTVFAVEVGGLTNEETVAKLREIAAEKTCEPCTVTEENPNGVAESPFDVVLQSANPNLPEIAKQLEETGVVRLENGVTIGEDGVPRNADGVSLELLQDAQAMGISPDEAAKLIADKADAAKTKAAPKAKAKPKAEGEA